MTVKDLREKLKDYPEDMQVVIVDESCGCNDLEKVSVHEVCLDRNINLPYMGAHSFASEYEKENGQGTPVLLIGF